MSDMPDSIIINDSAKNQFNIVLKKSLLNPRDSRLSKNNSPMAKESAFDRYKESVGAESENRNFIVKSNGKRKLLPHIIQKNENQCRFVR